MKKWLLAILCCGILVLSACGNSGETDIANTEVVDENTTVENTEVIEEETETTELVEETEEATEAPTEEKVEETEAPTEAVVAPTIVVTDEMVAATKARNIAYREKLEDPIAFGDCWPATAFGLLDIDNNGVGELIVCTSETDWKYPGTIMTYMNGKTIWGSDAWTRATMYYCPETGYLILKEPFGPYEKTPSGDWNGFIHFLKFEEQYIDQTYGVFLNSVASLEMTPAGEYVNCDAATAQAILNTYAPREILLESPYANTSENRDKYLPIDDAAIRALLESGNAR